VAPDDIDPELRRKFDAIVSGLDLAEIRDLAQVIPLRGSSPTRPELRRPPLPGRRMFRVRVNLDDSDPVIWRALDLRSDLPLDVVHQAIQSAFDWWDYHLNRFTLGGGPWDRDSQVFACQEDIDTGENDDEVVLDRLVRIDEVLQEPGDVLHYAYDYGDGWELTIRLEHVLPFEPGTSSVSCVAGERAAPPEDCGHLLTEDELADVVDDPAAFDLASVNSALQRSYAGLVDLGIDANLVGLVNRLRLTELGDDVISRAVELATGTDDVPADEMKGALRPHQWFLERASGDGIVLTAAGYLRPADVEAAAPLVPMAADWIGKNNRESHTYPLLEFRESLRRAGLLRKLKGKLLLTRAGASARRDPAELWRQLAARLRTLGASDDAFTSHATLLVLLYAATSAGNDLPLDRVARAMREFGWSTARGPLQAHDLYRLDGLTILRNVSRDPVDFRHRDRISPAAAALARAALTRG